MPNESIGGISVSISIDLQGLQAQLGQAQQMAQETGAAMAKAFDTASGSAGGLSSSLVDVGNSMQSLLGLGLALAPISAGIVELGKSALEAAGNFEQWQISFTRLLGSEQAAKNMLEDLVNFATSTPFEIPDVVSNAQRLMAFGFAAKDVIPTLTALGDAVSALGRGSVSLNSLVLAFGEMSAKGVVQLRQLNMMTNQGVPAIEILAKAYGVSAQQMSDAITKKLVPAAEAIPVLLKGMAETSSGMMEKQSQSFKGMLSNLADAATKTFAVIGNTMLPVAKQMEEFGFSALNSLTQVAKAFEGLPVPVQEGVIALAALTAAAAPIALALGAIGLAITSIGAAMPVLVPLAGILGGIAAGLALIHFADVDTEALHFFQNLRDGFTGLKDLVSSATDTLRSFGSQVSSLTNLVPGVNLAYEAIQKFVGSIGSIKEAILILQPPLDAARAAFAALAIATEYLSGHYKSMDEAGKAVLDSLRNSTKATVDALGPSQQLGGVIGGVTDHLVLGTAAHKDHAGAVSNTATAYKNWNDEVSAALGLGPGNAKIVQDLGGAFKYLGDQVAAADALWQHYIVDAGQALDIMAKGTGTVGGFTVSMENGIEVIKGSKEAIQGTVGTILDFTTVEGQASAATGGLTGSLDSQASSFTNLGSKAESGGKRARQALTGMEDGFRATTGQVSALSVGVAFLAMQLSGLTIFAGSGIDYSKGQSDLQHQLYLARQAAGDPTAQPTAFTVSTGGSQKGNIFSSLDDLQQAIQDAAKNTDSLTSSVSGLAKATSAASTSAVQYVDGVGNVYDSYQQMVDAINANPDLGGLTSTITRMATGATSATSAVQAATTAQAQFTDGLGNVYDSYEALTAAIAANPLLGGPATSSTGDKLSGPSTVSSTMAEALAKMAQATGGSGDSRIANVLGTYNGQVITGSPGMSLSDAIRLMQSGVGPGSSAVTALPGSIVTNAPTGNQGLQGVVPVASNQQNGPNGQGVTLNIINPVVQSQTQAEQVLSQAINYLRNTAGLKL